MSERDREIRKDESDRGADEPTRAANQPFAADEVPPSRIPAGSPTTTTDQPDQPAGAAEGAERPAPEGRHEPREHAGVPERTTSDVSPALGTSEASDPVEGVHTPDARAGGSDFDTAARPVPGRTSQGRYGPEPDTEQAAPR